VTVPARLGVGVGWRRRAGPGGDRPRGAPGGDDGAAGPRGDACSVGRGRRHDWPVAAAARV